MIPFVMIQPIKVTFAPQCKKQDSLYVIMNMGTVLSYTSET